MHLLILHCLMGFLVVRLLLGEHPGGNVALPLGAVGEHGGWLLAVTTDQRENDCSMAANSQHAGPRRVLTVVGVRVLVLAEVLLSLLKNDGEGTGVAHVAIR